MPVEISSLPIEILSQIFEHLDVPARIGACLVCKKWLQVMNCRHMLKNINVNISPEDIKTVNLFFRMSRQFCCFRFHDGIIPHRFLEFLKFYRNQFLSLTFVSCTVGKFKSASSQNKVPTCNNLQVLKCIDSSAFNLFPSLPNLTCLKVYEHNLTDYDLHQLDKTMPNLEIFETGTKVVYNANEYERFYTYGNTIENAPSNAILCYPSMKKFLHKRSSTITSFEWGEMFENETDVLELLNMKDLKLKKASLPYRPTEEFIQHLCENQPFLTEVNSKFTVTKIPDNFVISLCRSLTNLRELLLSFCFALNEGVVDIFQLQHLRKLDLRCCVFVSAHSFEKAISNSKITRLEFLSLYYTAISDDSLKQFLQSNTSIQNLNLGHTSVSDSTLNMICKSHTQLKYLYLRECRHITDAGLTGEYQNYVMTRSNKRHRTCRGAKIESTKSLSNLKNLRKLVLSRILSITDDGCIKAICLPFLNELDLTRCPLLHRSVCIRLKAQNPCLRNIQFSYDKPSLYTEIFLKWKEEI